MARGVQQELPKQKAVFTHTDGFSAQPGLVRGDENIQTSLPGFLVNLGINWWCSGWSGRLVPADGWMRRRLQRLQSSASFWK